MKFWWSKSSPGNYFIWSGPREDKRREHVGKVWRMDDGRYGAYFEVGAVNIRMPPKKTQPAAMIEALEIAIFRFVADVEFVKEGFS